MLQRVLGHCLDDYFKDPRELPKDTPPSTVRYLFGMQSNADRSAKFGSRSFNSSSAGRREPLIGRGVARGNSAWRGVSRPSLTKEERRKQPKRFRMKSYKRAHSYKMMDSMGDFCPNGLSPIEELELAQDECVEAQAAAEAALALVQHADDDEEAATARAAKKAARKVQRAAAKASTKLGVAASDAGEVTRLNRAAVGRERGHVPQSNAFSSLFENDSDSDSSGATTSISDEEEVEEEEDEESWPGVDNEEEVEVEKGDDGTVAGGGATTASKDAVSTEGNGGGREVRESAVPADTVGVQSNGRVMATAVPPRPSSHTLSLEEAEVVVVVEEEAEGMGGVTAVEQPPPTTVMVEQQQAAVTARDFFGGGFDDAFIVPPGGGGSEMSFVETGSVRSEMSFENVWSSSELEDDIGSVCSVDSDFSMMSLGELR